MKKFVLLFVVFCSFVIAGQCLAVTLSYGPSYQDVLPTDTVVLSLNISGLTSGGPPSLGAFDLDITFNNDILGFDSVVFSSFLGNPDPLSFETVTSVDASTPGVVALDEVSLLFDFELDDLQSDSFNLASLSFTGIGSGFNSFSIMESGVLSDAFGNTLDYNVVPEPGTTLLLFFGFVGITGFKRRFFKK